MKIAFIVPGSGDNFYCQNCLRDISLIKALCKLGHQAICLPMYLPQPEAIADNAPIFYGAINVYLKQKKFFRRMPHWAQRIMDSRRLLEWIAGTTGSTSAVGLEEMTLSILRGKDGNHTKELQKLLKWLYDVEKPDIVHLSNALLLGLAPQIKKALQIPVVCSLQDEDQWVDSMRDQYTNLVWDTMAEKTHTTDALVAVSHYYANVMRDRLHIADDKLHVVYNGIDIPEYPPHVPSYSPPVIGYLSRLAPSFGLQILVDAFIQLKRNMHYEDARLIAAGGCTGNDKKFVHSLRRKLSRERLHTDVEFITDYDRRRRVDFLKKISLLSVPILKGEAFGAFQIEALAMGIPVVQPQCGAFPEIVNATGGGLIYTPNTASELAKAIATLLDDPNRAKNLGQVGYQAVGEKFAIEQTANHMLKIYRDLLAHEGDDYRS